MIEKSAVRILMLDDESFMLKLLGRILANLGFTQVTSFDSGRAALESFDSPNTPPDLILLDLNMPLMDGVEFVRHLVERLYTGNLILISGENERMLQTAVKLMRAHQVSVLGHLHKPVKPEALSALPRNCRSKTSCAGRWSRSNWAALPAQGQSQERVDLRAGSVTALERSGDRPGAAAEVHSLA